MKLSYEWLKEYVDAGVGADELARALTMTGSAVESVKDVDGDKVMEMEITSNRPDCLSVLGLAREASAIFDKELHLPDLASVNGGKSGRAIACAIEAKDLCQRYTARVITNVTVRVSSDKISKRIKAVSLRPVNNIVDITNYCLMELGQPMHAFDLDKIRGAKVVVRRALKGEKIVTIDGVERTLEEGMLVIADTARVIAIAGVMGGLETEVTTLTKNILLESAYFDPLSVRRAARKIGLGSDSSYRFERGVDKAMVLPASDRAAKMIVEAAGGAIGELYDEGSADAKKTEVRFDVEKASRTLGVKLEGVEVKRIFKALGIEAEDSGGEALRVIVPSSRKDLEREVDLLEDVARIFGYENIPSTMGKIVSEGERRSKARKVDEKIRMTLAGMGLNEIMTYSLTNQKAVDAFSSVSAKPLELANPLSEEQRFLVPQLLDGMLRSMAWNINRKNKDLAFFEVGKTYSRTGESEKDINEASTLAIGLTGASRKNWKEAETKSGFFELKGIVEAVLGRLRIKSVFTAASFAEFSASAGISLGVNQSGAGFIGEVAPKTLAAYDIAQTVLVAQISIDELVKEAELEDSYCPIPAFPSSTRDVSILCDKGLEAASIKAAVEESANGMIRKVELIDLYEGDKLPDGKKSLTYSIDYGRDERTLTEEEVENAHSRIKQALTDKFRVSFR